MYDKCISNYTTITGDYGSKVGGYGNINSGISYQCSEGQYKSASLYIRHRKLV